ncbi:MAG: DUF1501 domain-containing protein [Acidobacteria bacterium]|jgi:hypothetical protein|nr:DUF1501 domain-containing protein [Acidobacteriota bacterium]
MTLPRRQLLRSLFSASALLPAVVQDLLANPLAPRQPHFPAKAKRVIFLYMTGGVSHVDTFDPKPALVEAAASKKTYGKKGGVILPSTWGSRRHGRCGTAVSDLFPEMAGIVDDLCVIRSLHTDHNDHFQATMGMHTGSVTVKRPSIGSWVSYGLGTENKNLPSFIALAPVLPYAGAQVWSSDFLPGAHAGTRIVGGAQPVADLARRAPSEKIQSLELGLLARLNQQHQAARPGDPALAARLQSFETAFGMQSEMPAVFDFAQESDATMQLYGLERGQTSGFGWQCLVARRLAERGVRFIELIDTGSSNNWDVHGEINNMIPLAKNVDKPIAGLIKDLKSRGMLDDTLVVWTTEFGRTPWGGPPHGREHYNKVFSSWLAGGGIKPGIVYGQSDELGIEIAENPVHVHDFHATILHCLGFDHTRLIYRHAGRDFRLTDVHGQVVKPLLA